MMLSLWHSHVTHSVVSRLDESEKQGCHACGFAQAWAAIGMPLQSQGHGTR
jgi:hypothetical protein